MLVLICLTISIIHCTFGQNYQITPIVSPKVDVAYDAVWDDERQSLFYTNFLDDNQSPVIFRYSIADGKVYSAFIPGASSVKFIVPTRKTSTAGNDLFAVGIRNTVAIISWDGISSSAVLVKTLFSVGTNDTTLDKARADSKGRLYFGTTNVRLCSAAPTSSLYRYTIDEGVELLFTGVYTTTGLRIDEKAGKLYHSDDCHLLVTSYDYDGNTGDICNGRVVFNFSSIGLRLVFNDPLGMEQDSDGILLIPDYLNTTIYAINPITNALLKYIPTGILGISGLAFGGPSRNILYLLASSKLLDGFTLATKDTSNTNSLFAITNLGDMGRETAYFALPPL